MGSRDRLLWQKISFVFWCLVLTGCVTTRSSPVYVIRVEKGDTLAGIAAKYDTTWEKIAKLNRLDAKTSVRPGTVLRVQPGPGGYAVGAELPAPSSARTAAKGKSVRRGFSGLFGSDAERAPDADNAMFEEAAKTQKKSPEKPRGRRRGGLLFGDESAPDTDERAQFSRASQDVIRWPLVGDISSFYGQRGRNLHAGIDIRAKVGTPIGAAAAGKVEFAGRQNGYGRIVIIRHRGLKTAYAHLASITVDEGDHVDVGQEIGSVGTTGNASGPHLHFEVRKLNGQAMDPMSILPRNRLVSSL